MEKIAKFAEKPEIKEVTPATTDGKIENFWTEILEKCGEFHGLLNKKDKLVLSNLTDVQVKLVPNCESNFSLLFFFKENEYFKQTVLERKHIFQMGASGDPEIKKIESTPIEWTSDEKNPTVEMKKVKVKCSFLIKRRKELRLWRKKKMWKASSVSSRIMKLKTKPLKGIKKKKKMKTMMTTMMKKERKK